MSAVAEGRARLQVVTRVAVLLMAPIVVLTAACSSDSDKSSVTAKISATTTVAGTTSPGVSVTGSPAAQPGGGNPGSRPYQGGNPQGGNNPQQPNPAGDQPAQDPGTAAPTPVKCTDQINYAGDPRSNAEINTLGEQSGHCPDPIPAPTTTVAPTTTTVAPTTTTDTGTPAPVTTTQTATPAPTTTTVAPTTTVAAPTTTSAN